MTNDIRTHHLIRSTEFVVEDTEWGRLEWSVSGASGTSEVMTAGTCFIHPGEANGRHMHPECDEILIVRAGDIIHTVGDESFAMTVGDVVSIPAGTMHNARNVGEGIVELAICFSSAHRTTVPEIPGTAE